MSAPLPLLAGAPWLRSQGLKRIFDAISTGGGDARVVGGAVRNALIGRAIGDLDVATTLAPRAVLDAAKAAGIKAIPTGIDHGTVTLVADGLPVEVTTLRKDIATDGRRAVVAYTTDWNEDALRRDFTINALYADKNGQIFDPVGGFEDLTHRKVRFIGQAEQRITEDYLRILRFFRFHAEIGQGAPDASGLAACASLADGLISISKERIRHELLRLLGAVNMVASVKAMAHANVLNAIGIDAPNITRLQRLAAIDGSLSAPASGVLRLGALALGPDMDADALALQFRLSKPEAGQLMDAESYSRLLTAETDTQAICTLAYRHGKAATLDALKFAWATTDTSTESVLWQKYWLELNHFVAPVFPISGRDLLALGYSPGKQLGRVLARLEAEWIAAKFAPSGDALIKRAKSLKP